MRKYQNFNNVNSMIRFLLRSAIAAGLLALSFTHPSLACGPTLGGGPWRFILSEDQSQVRILLGKLSYLEGGRSRPLSLHLVAYDPRNHATWFDDPYYVMATIDLRDYPEQYGDGTLDVLQWFADIDKTVAFVPPPDGTYEVALAGGQFDPRFGGPDNGYQLCALRAASIIDHWLVSEGGQVSIVPR